MSEWKEIKVFSEKYNVEGRIRNWGNVVNKLELYWDGREIEIGLETSFGVFICYTINTNNFKDLQGDAFRKKVAETMRQDIEKNITNILEIINKKSLYNYSFYFYFLPLSNAEIDSKAIIDNL